MAYPLLFKKPKLSLWKAQECGVEVVVMKNWKVILVAAVVVLEIGFASQAQAMGIMGPTSTGQGPFLNVGVNVGVGIVQPPLLQQSIIQQRVVPVPVPVPVPYPSGSHGYYGGGYGGYYGGYYPYYPYYRPRYRRFGFSFFGRRFGFSFGSGSFSF